MRGRTFGGHPKLIECMRICVLSLSHGSELRGSDVYLDIVISGYLKSVRVRFLGRPLPGFFFSRNISGKIQGGPIIFRDYSVSGLACYFLSSGQRHAGSGVGQTTVSSSEVSF